MITTIQQKEEKALGIVFFSSFWRAGEAKEAEMRNAVDKRACFFLKRSTFSTPPPEQRTLHYSSRMM